MAIDHIFCKYSLVLAESVSITSTIKRGNHFLASNPFKKIKGKTIKSFAVEIIQLNKRACTPH